MCDDAVNDDKINDLNEDGLYLRNGLGENINNGNNKHNYIEQGGVINQQDGQGNHFGGAINNPQAHNEHFGGVNELDQNNAINNNNDDDNNDDNNDEGQNQGENNNNHVEVSENKASCNDPNINDDDLDDNQQHNYDSTGDWNNEPNVDKSKDDNDRDPNDIYQGVENVTMRRRNHNMNTQGNNRGNIAPGLPSANNGTWINRQHWIQMGSHICPMISAMVVAEQARIRMTKEYFKIEVSKTMPQYGFRKGSKLFGDEGYQADKNELEANLLGRGCIDILS